MAEPSSDIPYGTLDLLVLKTLDVLGPLHGFGLARRIEQVAEGLIHLNQGSIYPALLRLQQKGWITSQWGASDKNRRAKYYALTRTTAGRRRATKSLGMRDKAGQNPVFAVVFGRRRGQMGVCRAAGRPRRPA